MNIRLGEKIRTLRKIKNISQETLARYLGVSFQAVSKWENGSAMPDVMMIPVGGTYTLDAKEAKDVIARANPACVVPMHVKTAHCPYPIAPMSVFLKEMGCEGLEAVAALEVSKGNASKGVVVMKPMADEL